MTDLHLHNSMTRRKEAFVPIDPAHLRIYLCGPTVYSRAHVGNARPVIMFDVLYRLLKQLYPDSTVTYVRNFTDVDDKINAQSTASGRSIRDITDETIRWYHEDMDALGALRPDHEPRATEYIPQMVAMISDLIAKGHAYEVEGHVLFDVRSYPDYGKLSGRSVDDMIAGARVEVAPYKRDPMDFVLWKPSDAATPGWDSPWGRGRPGWHIECSAMAEALLGPHFDIHGGGNDLTFPHHENEVAQSCCATPGAGFANVWLHNEMLVVEGKKMSKSLGNFFTIRDLLDQGIPGEVIRLVFLGTHYRKPIDWTAEKAAQARETLRGWYELTSGVEVNDDVPEFLIDLLANDMNTAGYLAMLHELARADKGASLKAGMRLIGLPDAEQVSWFVRGPAMVSTLGGHHQLIRTYLGHWQKLRDEKRYEEADAYKKKLEATGLKVSVTTSGPHAEVADNFDPSKLEDLK